MFEPYFARSPANEPYPACLENMASKSNFLASKSETRETAPSKKRALQQPSIRKMAHDKRTEDGAETKKCARCESQKLRLILRFLDPRTGNHVRLYKCECGERVWEEE